MSFFDTRSFAEQCRHAITKISQGQNLHSEEMESLFEAMLTANNDDSSDELVGKNALLLVGLLAALKVKGETAAELVGAARAMRRHATRIQVIGSPVVDIVGTGGDSLHTFNISTTSAFVAAGAGVIVAKHGNRAVSSRCGSADVLEQCGVNLQLPHEYIEELIAEIGIGFLFARRFHPAMKRVATLRQQLGFRTIFNLLGPLTNPAGANCVLLGVYEPQLTEMFAAALAELGCRRAMIVHGEDGMDELTLTTRSRVTELKDGFSRTSDFFPELYFDGELATSDELRGGDAAENAEILKGILTGKIRGGKRNIVLLNTAAALVCAGCATDIADGIRIATESIDSGAAHEKLCRLVELSNNIAFC